MKLLFVINSLGYGGAESQLIEIIPEFLDRNYEVILVTINNDLRLEYRLDKRTKHYNLGMKRAYGIFKAIGKISSIVKNEKPDILHSHLFQANLLSRYLKFRFPNLRVINTTHCNYNLNTRFYNPYFVYKFTSKYVDYHTAVSKSALDALLNNGSADSDNSGIVFNSISLEKFNDIQQRPENLTFKWIAVGRLIPDKDYFNLLGAAKILIGKGCDFTIDIAGDGYLKGELQANANTFDADERIKFIGIVKDIPKLLAMYDGYIISSQNEGLPMALIEAMAAGLPVVGTKVGQIEDVIAGSGGGIVVESKNESELANAMEQLMKMNKESLLEYGDRNKNYTLINFSNGKLADIWEKIYSKSNN